MYFQEQPEMFLNLITTVRNFLIFNILISCFHLLCNSLFYFTTVRSGIYESRLWGNESLNRFLSLIL